MTTTEFQRAVKRAHVLERELRQAERRIAELEAAEGRVRAIGDHWQKVGDQGGMATEDVLLRAVAYQLRAALDGPLTDDRKADR